jgi:hypothetical protein
VTYSLGIHDTKATKCTSLGMCNLLIWCQSVINNARNEQHKVYSLHFGLTTDKSSGTNPLLQRNRTYSSAYTRITQSTPYEKFHNLKFSRLNATANKFTGDNVRTFYRLHINYITAATECFLVLARGRNGLLATFRCNMFPTVCTYCHYQSTATINILLPLLLLLLLLLLHNTRKRQTSMSPAGFEPTIPAKERLTLTTPCNKC